MSEAICPLNICNRPVGIGTHANVVVDGEIHTVAICEEHWQAIRVVYPLPLPAVPS